MLQVFWADRVVDAVNSPLRVAPQAFHGVDVGSPIDILSSSVLDGLMGIAELAKATVGAEFVSVDDGASDSGDVLLEALRNIQRDVDMGNPSYARAWRIAEAAIAAAEGRVT